ncbi:hypothetical protein YC2023_058433 [Brassica napus]
MDLERRHSKRGFEELAEAGDDNRVYSPCSDSTVAVGDVFTFGIAFAARAFFFGTNRSVQYSPCDRRQLSLSGNYELAIFRPKVDEITLLTINTSSNSSSFCPRQNRVSTTKNFEENTQEHTRTQIYYPLDKRNL